MHLNPDFELMQMADDYIVTPVGRKVDAFHGIIVVSEPAFFLLSHLKEPKTKEELVQLLTEEYEVDAATAEADIDGILGTLFETGVLHE